MTGGNTLARRAFEVFDELVELPDAARQAKLESLQGSDPTLHALVERLLAADREVGDAPVASERVAQWEAAVAQALPLPEVGAAMIGQMLGGWRIVSLLGRGGMGAVYLAEREGDEFRQRAALKLIRVGLDSPRARERFIRERSILARLAHPNIATLLDGGMTDAGVPYFAMTHVEGERIDQWCDARALSVRERVRLLLQVLDALAFAHRQLVVHRDLKPSNIVVDANGHVVLLDFGIAKLLEDAEEPGQTRTGDRAFTPEYASPEQLHGEPVSTATDLYQAGVLLYALLAHAHPFGLTGDTPLRAQLTRMRDDPQPLWEAAKGISVVDAGKCGRAPGALAGELKGDLSAIAGHCLASDPRQRYGSVEALRDDLLAWLDGRPVSAREPTLRYRASRFLRRHALAVGATAAVAATLVTGLAVSLWQADIARREARNAREQQHLAERQRALAGMQANSSLAVQEMLAGMFSRSLAMDGGHGTTVSDIIGSARTMGMDPEAMDAPARAQLLLRLARIYAIAGGEQEAREFLATARPLAAGAGAIRTRLLAQELDTFVTLAMVRDDYPQIIQLSPILLRLLDSFPQPLDEEMLQIRLGVLRTLGFAYDQRGNAPLAIATRQRSLRALTGRYGADHPRTRAARSDLALVHRNQGHYSTSAALMRESLQGMARTGRPASMDQLVMMLEFVDVLRRSEAGASEALQVLEAGRAVAEQEGMPSIFGPWVMALRADILRESGDLEGAAAALRDLPPFQEEPGFQGETRAVRAMIQQARSDLAWAKGDAAGAALAARAGLASLEGTAPAKGSNGQRRLLNLRLRLLRAEAATLPGADVRSGVDAVLGEWEGQPVLLRGAALMMAAETLRLAGAPDRELAQRAVAAADGEPEPDPRRQRIAHRELRLAQE